MDLRKAQKDYAITVKDVFSWFPKTNKYYFNNWDWTANVPIWWNNWLFTNNNVDVCGHCYYNGGKTLRDEQLFIINKIKNESINSWTIMMKTWRWKTLVMLKLIELFKLPTLVLCHNKDNVKSISETINNEMDIDASIVMSWYKKWFDFVCVTTHNWFRLNPGDYLYKGKPYWMILYDECDYNLSFPKWRDPEQKSMSTSLINYDADVMFGLTWTPFLKDTWERWVTLMFGDIIAMEDQDNWWYNIIPEIEVHSYKSENFYLFEDWHQLVNSIQEDETRTEEVVEYVYKKAWKYNLALFKYVAEVDKFYELFKEKYIKNDPMVVVIKLHWQMSKKDYEIEMKILNVCIWSGIKFLIVGTTDKIGRWKDIPILDTMFLLYPCKFEWNVIQAVGRWLRSHPWKNKVMLYDWRDEHPVLLKQAKQRVKTYFNEYPWCNVYKS